MKQLIEIPKFQQDVMIPLWILLNKDEFVSDILNCNYVFKGKAVKITIFYKDKSINYCYDLVLFENKKDILYLYELTVNAKFIDNNVVSSYAVDIFDRSNNIFDKLKIKNFDKEALFKEYDEWKINNRGLISAKNLNLI